VQCGDARAERDQVRRLYQALTEAKKKSGEASPATSTVFLPSCRRKPIRSANNTACEAVEYTVEMQNGQVKLKAKAKA